MAKKPRPYLTPKYYFEDYGGTRIGERGELLRLIRAAQLKVNTLTFNRIPAGGGFDALSEFQQGCVREAMCHIVDYIADSGYTEGGGIKSYAVLDIAATMGDNTGSAAQMGVPPEARDLLLQSGLMCRRL